MNDKRWEAFWNKVDKRGEDDCWIWTAGTTQSGYGSFRFTYVDDDGNFVRRANQNAHRISWALHHNNGKIPGRLEVVMHSCDVKRCVNPKHLSLGSIADNTRDYYKKKVLVPSEGLEPPANRVET